MKLLKIPFFITFFILNIKLIAQDSLNASHHSEYKLYLSGGVSINSYFYNQKFKLSNHSPISGYIEIGINKKLNNWTHLLTSINYQPFFLINQYTEFYDYSNWTSIGITADYFFHKLNFKTALLLFPDKRWNIATGLGISYTPESVFKLKNFACAFPYGSSQYQNIRNYYYFSFYSDDKGVIINKVLTPFVNIDIFYQLQTHLTLHLNYKYELSKIPANHTEWTLFQPTPLSIGVMYNF